MITLALTLLVVLGLILGVPALMRRIKRRRWPITVHVIPAEFPELADEDLIRLVGQASQSALRYDREGIHNLADSFRRNRDRYLRELNRRGINLAEGGDQ